MVNSELQIIHYWPFFITGRIAIWQFRYHHIFYWLQLIRHCLLLTAYCNCIFSLPVAYYILLDTYCRLLSGQRSLGHHRCVTPLYVIPMWIFNCVIDRCFQFLLLGFSNCVLQLLLQSCFTYFILRYSVTNVTDRCLYKFTGWHLIGLVSIKVWQLSFFGNNKSYNYPIGSAWCTGFTNVVMSNCIIFFNQAFWPPGKSASLSTFK